MSYWLWRSLEFIGIRTRWTVSCFTLEVSWCLLVSQKVALNEKAFRFLLAQETLSPAFKTCHLRQYGLTFNLCNATAITYNVSRVFFFNNPGQQLKRGCLMTNVGLLYMMVGSWGRGTLSAHMGKLHLNYITLSNIYPLVNEWVKCLFLGIIMIKVPRFLSSVQVSISLWIILTALKVSWRNG